MDPAIEVASWLHDQVGHSSGDDRRCRYFSVTEGSGPQASGQWHDADCWPPNSKQTPIPLVWNQKKLGQQIQTGQGTTGVNSRWNGVLGTGKYPPMEELNPLGCQWETHGAGRLHVAGQVNLKLTLVTAASEAARLHAILELVVNGRPSYLTEGTAAISPSATDVHVSFLPIAFDLRDGSELRLTLLGADRDNYQTSGIGHAQTLQVQSVNLVAPVVSGRDR